MPASTPSEVFEKYEDREIGDELLKQAAQLFSENYGVWGPMAEGNMGNFAKKGRRVRMSVNVLRQQCLPTNSRTVYVRVNIDGQLVGNVLACRWEYQGQDICWISQLVVSANFRKRGLATKLLLHLRQDGSDRGFGILSSHPAAIRATLRAFSRGLDEVDLGWVKANARGILASAPIGYVRNASLRGSLFEQSVEDGTVSSAFTAFWVDHQEPFEGLTYIQEQGKVWPFGSLLQGHEFLLIVKAKSDDSSHLVPDQ